MRHHVILKPDGTVERVVHLAATDPPPVGAAGEVLAWAGIPAQPWPGAALIFEAGQLRWRDTRTLAECQTQRWDEIKATRQALDNAPITIGGGIPLDGDEKSRNNILGAVVAMQLASLATRNWRCADNVMRVLTLAQIVEAGLGIAARRQSLIETSDALYHQIQAATTPAQVAAVVWP